MRKNMKINKQKKVFHNMINEKAIEVNQEQQNDIKDFKEQYDIDDEKEFHNITAA